MASGSSGRTGSGSKGFDFGSDDLLCSYDEFGNQETSNGNHTDPMIGNNSGNDFRESRKARSGLLHVYNQPDESPNQDLLSTVEKAMKKYADNLLRFLEGISARLSQLELYCYNLEKSVGEMRSDLLCEHKEADLKLKSLEKHLQEVHRSVQILRDKQELAETQKELSKLQVAKKESSVVSHSQNNEEGVAPSASDPKKTDRTAEVHNQQLALTLPHHVTQPSSLPTRSVDQQHLAPTSQTSQNIHVRTQPQAYYPSQNQLPNPQSQPQSQPQEQYLQVDSQYQRSQLQDLSRQAPQPPQPQVNPTQQTHPYPSYQQQWPQQFPQQVQPSQQPSQQPTVRPQTPPVYPPYPPTQAANPSPETFPGIMPAQLPFSGLPQSGVSRVEPMPYGYSGAGRTTVQQPPLQLQRQPQPQTNQSTFGAHVSDGAYPGVGPHLTQSPGQGFMMYDGEGGRTPYPPPHYPQGGYPPTHVSSIQSSQPGSSLLVRHPSPSRMMRGSHPYSELIEKAVSMGYGRDHVSSVIHRMEESGQPVDFNAVLDRLDIHPSGGSQRGWSG